MVLLSLSTQKWNSCTQSRLSPILGAPTQIFDLHKIKIWIPPKNLRKSLQLCWPKMSFYHHGVAVCWTEVGRWMNVGRLKLTWTLLLLLWLLLRTSDALAVGLLWLLLLMWTSWAVAGHWRLDKDVGCWFWMEADDVGRLKRLDVGRRTLTFNVVVAVGLDVESWSWQWTLTMDVDVRVAVQWTLLLGLTMDKKRCWWTDEVAMDFDEERGQLDAGIAIRVAVGWWGWTLKKTGRCRSMDVEDS